MFLTEIKSTKKGIDLKTNTEGVVNVSKIETPSNALIERFDKLNIYALELISVDNANYALKCITVKGIESKKVNLTFEGLLLGRNDFSIILKDIAFKVIEDIELITDARIRKQADVINSMYEIFSDLSIFTEDNFIELIGQNQLVMEF